MRHGWCPGWLLSGAGVLLGLSWIVWSAQGQPRPEAGQANGPSRQRMLAAGRAASGVQAEARHYRIIDLSLPPDIVLEVGGLALRDDGKMLCCTRRGEVWLLSGYDREDATVEARLFASGLHEPLGLCLDGRDVYVVQRPELTRLVDSDGTTAPSST